MFEVMSDLFVAAALGFKHGFFHRVGDPVGVQNSPAVDVTGSASDGLYETAFSTQKPFFIGVQNGYE